MAERTGEIRERHVAFFALPAKVALRCEFKGHPGEITMHFRLADRTPAGCRVVNHVMPPAAAHQDDEVRHLPVQDRGQFEFA